MTTLKAPASTVSTGIEGSQYTPDADGLVEVHSESHELQLRRHGYIDPPKPGEDVPVAATPAAVAPTTYQPDRAPPVPHVRAALIAAGVEFGDDVSAVAMLTAIDGLMAQAAAEAAEAPPEPAAAETAPTPPPTEYNAQKAWLKNLGVQFVWSTGKEAVQAMVDDTWAQVQAGTFKPNTTT